MRLKVCPAHEIHEERGTRLVADDREIALFRRDGAIYAINNVCAHQHCAVLHQGLLDGLNVTCPMHGWTYDLRTGKATTGQGAVARYDTRVEHGIVYVELPDET
jgi:NAD(P)H-dependent nitrite reductase small subunit